MCSQAGGGGGGGAFFVVVTEPCIGTSSLLITRNAIPMNII